MLFSCDCHRPPTETARRHGGTFDLDSWIAIVLNLVLFDGGIH
jgi:hypothetical protein